MPLTGQTLKKPQVSGLQTTVTKMHPTDRLIAGEVLATLAAVFDLAAAALASDSPDAAEHCRSTGNANLQVAARLLQYLAQRAKLDHPATAAEAGSPGEITSAAVADFVTPGGDMRSDEPGFANPMPGTADVTHGDSYTQGSTGSMRPASGELGQAPVSADPFASAQGPRPMTAQGYGSTSDGSDPFRDAISGVVSPPPVVPGAKISTPHHPNAESGGGR